MQQPQESLTKSTSRALGWNYLGAFTRLFLNFGISVILARLLGPRPFGEIAIAVLLFGLGNLFAGLGVGAALVQKPEITQNDIRFCFTSQMLVGSAISLLLAVTAPLWAAFFHQPELTLLLRVLSPLFFLQSFGTISSAVLNRNQNTRPIQIASVASYTIAFALIAVPMALKGFGVWSLATAYLTQAFVNSLLLYMRVRHSLRPLLHRDGIALFRFGLSVLGANICNWGISNLDNTVVGRVSGPVALGFYSRAFNLALLPSDIIVSNLQQVMLPAFSRAQQDTKRLARVFLAVFGLVAILLLPPFCAMAAVPQLVILGLYGAKWMGAVRLFQPLALALPIHSLMALAGPTLSARGKPRTELAIQLPIAVIAAVAFSFSVRYSVLAMSWVVLGVYVLRWFGMTRAVLLELGIAWRELGKVVWPALVLVAVAAGSALIMNQIVPGYAIAVRLFLVIVSVAVLTLTCAMIWRRALIQPILRDTPQIEQLLLSRLGRLRAIW